ncbi:pentapeptide repeat-containing protein [Nocardia colli]|uniref:pentapeptide repeat-containing protein n=1 Tax=Nocardia colli TaxID=2545717 RepID=UPI00168D71AC|nr:pentapeptide repeat-containing protein [Nocardia colli]
MLHTIFTWPGWTTFTASVTALAAVAALYFTGQTLRATNNQNSSARDSAITERFAKATEQLSSDKLNSRVAGVYLLGRLARDSADDRTAVVDVLSAFVRTSSPLEKCNGRPRALFDLQADIQAVLTVLSRLPPSALFRTDLSRICLAGANLRDGSLAGVNFFGSDLTDSVFDHVDLTRAELSNANLTRVGFGNTTLVWAHLDFTNLTEAEFAGVQVDWVSFAGANVAGAKLRQAWGLEADMFPRDPGGLLVYCDSKTRWPPNFNVPPCRSEP